MNTITLNRPKRRQQQQRVVLKVASRKYNFLMELLGNLNFVQVEEKEGDTREEIIANLKEAAKSLKQINDGKLKGCPAEDLLKEL